MENLKCILIIDFERFARFPVVRRPRKQNPHATYRCEMPTSTSRLPAPSPRRLESQWGEEPSVLPAQVSLLQSLLDVLLRILSLRNFLERVVRDDALQSFQLKRVSRRHDVVVVDHLDEWLDL